jgi:hypothetical protein
LTPSTLGTPTGGKEYKAKTAVEWRLSYGLWAALLGAAGVIVAHGDKLDDLKIPGYMVWGLAVVTSLSHAMFLGWIHWRLREYRGKLRTGQDELRNVLLWKTSEDSPHPEINLDDKSPLAPVGLGVIALFVQLVVTVGLWFLLFAVVVRYIVP